MSDINTDIRFLKGVGERRAAVLSDMGIDTIGALLRFYPRAYEDYTVITPISKAAAAGGKVCIRAEIITEIKEHFVRRNMTLYRFNVADGSQSMTVTLFNVPYLAAKLKTGREYLFLGKVNEKGFYAEMSSPEIKEVGTAGIEPIYRASKKMSSSSLKNLVKNALSVCSPDDPVPQKILDDNGLCDLSTAILNIHFPKSREALEVARKRLVFEELFVLETGLMLLKKSHRKLSPCVIKNDYTAEFASLLPFELTNAQKSAIKDAVLDMRSGKSMNRLVQGDVGSGKTAVAQALMYTVVKNGMQAALMVPTEILAEQHYNGLCRLFENTDIKICLLTGSVPKSKKNAVKQRLSAGVYDIAIGTHALITEDTEFLNLGLVITDEQHRFGVSQRTALTEKGLYPHTLVMSATPIPGTVAMVLYGDLDISTVNEYPKGRQGVDTYLVGSALRQRAYNYIKKHIEEGRQGYIVCPAVEGGDDPSQLSAEDYYAGISEKEFAAYNVGLLHGKMKPKDKEKIMRSFALGEIDLLVCTTVIEVGIDVPNAAIMLIENAERFGLSQLHQLRGRIGRGGYKSTCILISDSDGSDTKKRLSIITHSSNGFEIADEDLKLRGPGDFLGDRQHGLPPMRIADISADAAALRIAGSAAEELVANDPKLKKPENAALKTEISDLYKRLKNS